MAGAGQAQCGVEDGPKPPHVRVWTCGACGAVLDRDVNAAVDVAEAAGLAVSTCGAQIRPGVVPAPRGEAGTHFDTAAFNGSVGGNRRPSGRGGCQCDRRASAQPVHFQRSMWGGSHDASGPEGW